MPGTTIYIDSIALLYLQLALYLCDLFCYHQCTITQIERGLGRSRENKPTQENWVCARDDLIKLLWIFVLLFQSWYNNKGKNAKNLKIKRKIETFSSVGRWIDTINLSFWIIIWFIGAHSDLLCSDFFFIIENLCKFVAPWMSSRKKADYYYRFIALYIILFLTLIESLTFQFVKVIFLCFRVDLSRGEDYGEKKSEWMKTNLIKSVIWSFFGLKSTWSRCRFINFKCQFMWIFEYLKV